MNIIEKSAIWFCIISSLFICSAWVYMTGKNYLENKEMFQIVFCSTFSLIGIVIIVFAVMFYKNECRD